MRSNLKQEPGGRNQNRDYGRILLIDLLGLFSYTNSEPPAQEMTLPTVGYALLQPNITQENAPLTCPQASLTETFSPSLQNCEKTCFCRVSHPTCGILLQQLSQANETPCLFMRYPRELPNTKAEWQMQGKVQLAFN